MKNQNKITHPGETLSKEFLVPMGISANKLAAKTGIPQSRVSEMISGKRNITAGYALRLGKFFILPPQYWLNLQNTYNLAIEEKKIAKALIKIPLYTEFVKDKSLAKKKSLVFK